MGKSHTGSERRKYRRLRKKIVVRLQVHSKDKAAAGGGHDIISLQDISAGGALLTYNKEIDIGTLVELNMRFATFPESINCLGKVIRVQPASPKTSAQIPLYHIAVRFIETVDKKEQQLLEEIIEEYHSREVGDKGAD